MFPTVIHSLVSFNKNQIYIKREDLIPYSFGGNKARKAILFFEEIDSGDFDCVVTYGSSHSNHARVVANMAAGRELLCYIVSPQESSEPTYNSKLMELFGAEIITVPVEAVSKTIDDLLEQLKKEGKKPYFILGGGHGNIGTQAYVNCYKEIKKYEDDNNIFFNYVFFASGTGTTQAGLVCGQLMENDDKQIIGISIARKVPYGRDVVIQSIRDYLEEHQVNVSRDEIEAQTFLVDTYAKDGYAKSSDEINSVIHKVMLQLGIPMDSTYTGKAFYGMLNEIENQQLKDKNILFIHTGGTPLFFDEL